MITTKLLSVYSEHQFQSWQEARFIRTPTVSLSKKQERTRKPIAETSGKTRIVFV